MPSASHPQADDIRAARRGDRDALDRLLKSIEERLARQAETRLGASLRAKIRISDVLQSTYLDVMKSLDKFRGETPEAWDAWVISILENNIRDKGKYFQRQKRQGESALPSSENDVTPLRDIIATPSAAIAFSEEWNLIQTAMARLPADYRTIIDLHTHRGLDYKECAKTMERTPAAVRTLYHRASLYLQIEIEKLRGNSGGDGALRRKI
jgi:RNA polymerase sigma-70 factor, ECF subfamily